jgi:O-acetyl-ADP-ribose deacetylase (regulator of RNase III)
MLEDVARQMLGEKVYKEYQEICERKVSMRVMCRIISSYLKETQGIIKTPTEVYNSSPRGELMFVFQDYVEAMFYYKNKKRNAGD